MSFLGERAAREDEVSDPISNLENVDPRDLRPGPIRHESLSPELLEQIKAVFGVIGPYFGTPLEQFEVGFMRDAYPESEVTLWSHIAAAWLAYHQKFLNDETRPVEEERTLLGALIAISAGVEDPAELGVPDEVGHKLLQCYRDL